MQSNTCTFTHVLGKTIQTERHCEHCFFTPESKRIRHKHTQRGQEERNRQMLLPFFGLRVQVFPVAHGKSDSEHPHNGMLIHCDNCDHGGGGGWMGRRGGYVFVAEGGGETENWVWLIVLRRGQSVGCRGENTQGQQLADYVSELCKNQYVFLYTGLKCMWLFPSRPAFIFPLLVFEEDSSLFKVRVWGRTKTWHDKAVLLWFGAVLMTFSAQLWYSIIFLCLKWKGLHAQWGAVLNYTPHKTFKIFDFRMKFQNVRYNLYRWT